MTLSSFCGMILGWLDKGLRLLRDKTDGGSVIKSDSARFEVAHRDRSEGRSILVKLSGEFDVRYQKMLEDTLGDCLASGRPTFVDLSGVTFMDSRCAQELVVYYQLGKERVALCDPSQEVELSVVACDLEAWINFVYATGLERSPRQHRGERLPQGGNEDDEGNLHAHTIHGGKP
jgi:anti-anti-sigma factor